MSITKKDICISVEMELNEKKRKEFLDLIKQKFQEHGKSEKFLLEVFDREVKDIKDINEIYIRVRSEGNIDPTKNHRQNSLFGEGIKLLLRKFKFNAHLCETCDFCGHFFFETKEEKIKWCAKCKERFYCSRECQKKDWKDHEIVCKSPPPPPQSQPVEKK